MSNYFVRSKNENAKEKFNKKQLFKIVSQSEHANLIDFTYGEKLLYGRVDRFFQPIIPNNDYFQFKGVRGGTTGDIKVFNFVADAFRELQIKFTTKLAQGELEPNDPNLTFLEAVGGYRDPKLIYSKRKQAFMTAVQNIVINHELQFSNFNEFINVLMPYIENSIKVEPMTFPAFVKSRFCPMHINGLVIEIAEINPNNDKIKYDNFYESPNWEFFLNACNAYGFMVDSNMPNRIIADLNSPHMIEKMAKYDSRISSADMCITNCYTPVAIIDYDNFKKMIYQIYSNNRRRQVLSTTYTSPTGVQTTERKIKNYRYEDFVLEVSDKKIMEIYFKIRFLEEESKFSKYEKTIITRDCYEIFKANQPMALQIFEKILGKTFDYSGSLSYIQDRQKQLRQ
jgi:hypothetical protein